ncbi:hypothetical protein [Spirillospora sp. CA-128828]|uniref:hypothetical protein n=1 Tax=Spirillospora sp. CA-128828 TaxID=3240033 RepID=UPI003D93B8A1
MPPPVKVRACTYNLREGGLDGPAGKPRDESRLQEQIALLASLDLDLIGLQEANWGSGSDAEDRLARVAEQLGMRWSLLGRSNLYGCHLAALVRESDNLTVEDAEHLTGSPWVHTLLNVTLRVAGRPRPLHFLVGHSAPSSPAMRLAEAEMATVHKHLDVIYVADFNAAALTDDPDTTGIDPVKALQKLDTRPARTLAGAGLSDVGALMNDPTPSVGHDDDKLTYRCDRIHTTLPPEWITGYGVVPNADDLSDHRAVWAEFTPSS